MTTYKQTRKPDFNIAPLVAQGKVQTSWAGWCLAVARSVFNIPSVYNTATESWNVSNTKHADYSPPEGVYFVLYWAGGTAHGADNSGHIAIGKRTGDQIEVWSSPTEAVANYRKFKGKINTVIAEITKAYGASKYLGWTCDINGYAVIEKVIEVPATAFVLEYPTASGGKASFVSDKNNIDELLKKIKARMEKMNDSDIVEFTVRGK